MTVKHVYFRSQIMSHISNDSALFLAPQKSILLLWAVFSTILCGIFLWSSTGCDRHWPEVYINLPVAPPLSSGKRRSVYACNSNKSLMRIMTKLHCPKHLWWIWGLITSCERTVVGFSQTRDIIRFGYFYTACDIQTGKWGRGACSLRNILAFLHVIIPVEDIAVWGEHEC